MTDTSVMTHIPQMQDAELKETIDALKMEAVRRRIEDRRARAREVMEYARERGFSSTAEIRRALDATVPDPESRDVYVNPKDPTMTWAGRGRKPSWLKALEADGVDISTLRQ